LRLGDQAIDPTQQVADLVAPVTRVGVLERGDRAFAGLEGALEEIRVRLTFNEDQGDLGIVRALGVVADFPVVHGNVDAAVDGVDQLASTGGFHGGNQRLQRGFVGIAVKHRTQVEDQCFAAEILYGVAVAVRGAMTGQRALALQCVAQHLQRHVAELGIEQVGFPAH